MVVLADSLMTFFGSTANDAAFNAWTADIASTHTRGRVEGVLNLSVFLAQIVAMVAAGILIDQAGYFVFFYVLGGIVILSGIIAGSLLQDTPLPPEPDDGRRSFWAEIADLFHLDTLRNNRPLFILLLYIMVISIGMQVALPYLIIYLENFRRHDQDRVHHRRRRGRAGQRAAGLPLGLLADRWDRRKMIVAVTVIGSIGAFLFSLATAIWAVALTAFSGRRSPWRPPSPRSRGSRTCCPRRTAASSSASA